MKKFHADLETTNRRLVRTLASELAKSDKLTPQALELVIEIGTTILTSCQLTADAMDRVADALEALN